MYKCHKCRNNETFKEINSVVTYLKNGEKTDEKFLEREDVICIECGAKYSEGMVAEIRSELPQLHTDIMTEITTFCSHECGNVHTCSEDDCVLYRIERLVMEDC